MMVKVQYRSRWSWARFIVALAAWCWTTPLRAVTIGASPAAIEATIPAGVSAEQKITIFNEGDKPLLFVLSAQDIGLDERGKPVFSDPGTMPGSMAAWLSFLPKEVTVPARGQASVKVIISVPADAKGGHFALIRAMTRHDITKDGATVGVGAAIGIKLYHQTPGRSTPLLELGGAKLIPPSTSERLRVELEVVNSGDVHVRANATLAIIDKSKRLVGKAEVERRLSLLPKEKGLLTLNWGGVLDPGEYSAVTTIVYAKTGSIVVEQPFKVGVAASATPSAAPQPLPTLSPPPPDVAMPTIPDVAADTEDPEASAKAKKRGKKTRAKGSKGR